MKSTTNVFLGGLKTDYHPLTQDQQGLTDALNATLITYNGNEMMLQNDMGNTKIQDSTTGNIMGLRDGFVPLGMKEYGGILYIASYNLNTKEGELGTIPSPVFNYTADTKEKVKTFEPYCIMSGADPLYDGKTLIDEVKKYNLYTENPYNVSDNRFQVGDLFIFSLDIEELDNRTVRKGWFGLDKAPDNIEECYSVEFPYITLVIHSLELNPTILYSGPGWFRLDLLSKTANSDNAVKLEDVPTRNGNWYSTDSAKLFELQTSDYWFINGDISNMDVDRTIANYKYQNYPNIEPGYLWVKLEPEMPYNFNTEKITVHVTFVGELPTFDGLVPPEEGTDPTPGQGGGNQDVPDTPVIPDDPDPDPDNPEDPENPETPPVVPPPSETVDDINSYLLPYDGTPFDKEGLSLRESGTRLRSPFRRYWKGTVTRDEESNTIIYDEDENTDYPFADQSILYLSANDVAAFTATYSSKTDPDGEMYLTNYYMRENQCNTLSYNPYVENGYISVFNAVCSDNLLVANGYNTEEWALKDVYFWNLFDYTSEIPNFNNFYVWGDLPLKKDENGKLVTDAEGNNIELVNTLYVYHDPDGDNNAGKLTQITGDKQSATSINDSTGQFGLQVLDTKLLFQMLRDLLGISEDQLTLLTEILQENKVALNQPLSPFMVSDSRINSNRLFTIPYVHEKAIVAIPMNIGNTADSGDSETEYALALVVFPHIEFPKFDNKGAAYRSSDWNNKAIPYILYNLDNVKSSNMIAYRSDLFKADGTFDDGISTGDKWFLDYDDYTKSTSQAYSPQKRSGGDVSEEWPGAGDISLVAEMSWYESDYMQKLYGRDFILGADAPESVYNMDNGSYIYNDGNPVPGDGKSDWDIQQACAIFPFVTRTYTSNILGIVSEEDSTEAIYIGYPEIQETEEKEGEMYGKLVVPYIKIALEIPDDKPLIHTKHTDETLVLGYHSVLDYTGIWVHAVSEVLHPTNYYHKDLLLHHDKDSGQYNIPGGIKLTSGYLTVTPVDLDDIELLDAVEVGLTSEWVPGEANPELARVIINDFLSKNDCVFIDENETNEDEKRKSVHVRYCRAHEEAYKK